MAKSNSSPGSKPPFLEHNPLLTKKAGHYGHISRVCCIPYRGAFVVLIWSLLIHSAGFTENILHYSDLVDFLKGNPNYMDVVRFLILSIMILTLLFAPVAGFLAERCFTRFRFLLGSTIIVIIGYVIVSVSAKLNFDEKNRYTGFSISTPLKIALCTGLVVYRIGWGMFEANVIQFGVDQLQFAGNDELGKFVNWYFWTRFVLTWTLISLILIPFSNAFTVFYYMYLSFSQIIFATVCSIVALLIVIYSFCKGHFIIEPTSYYNPVALIAKVLNYARQHKVPVRRSAFTYGEDMPSRIDIGKERYGGPFTSEQVEDVKSFLRILLLLSSLFGMLLINFERDPFGQILFHYPTLSNETFTMLYISNAVSSLSVSHIILIVGIPFYMCILRPLKLIRNHTPNMLKNMGIGLLVICFKLSFDTVSAVLIFDGFSNITTSCMDVVSFSTSEDVIPLRENTQLIAALSLIVIAQILSGVGFILVYLTAFKFILAQSPRNMQSFLIGLFYFYTSFQVMLYLVSTLPNSYIFCNYWFYAMKTGLGILSFLLYVVVSRHYKYRQRDELSTVNYQTIIEEYTDRHLQRQKNLMAESNSAFSLSDYSIRSANICPH
uniref:Uncharacterized protein n=1 Tax=Amphimedon queenslandica TaxID=400682 RepID=A0A1X7TW58_AMPQE